MHDKFEKPSVRVCVCVFIGCLRRGSSPRKVVFSEIRNTTKPQSMKTKKTRAEK